MSVLTVAASGALAALRVMGRPALIIYDCDGVLIDSEPVASRVCAEEISALGWIMDTAESHARFLGMSLSAMVPAIEAHTGKKVPASWSQYLAARLAETLAIEAVMIDGAEAALRSTTALGLDWCIASNSGPEELVAKFACCGLTALVAGRVHSANEVISRGGLGKPAPDLFLAAALAANVDPACCLVIEDSAAGITAAAAAGMTCLAYSPDGERRELTRLGSQPFSSMRELPGLFRAVL